MVIPKGIPMLVLTAPTEYSIVQRTCYVDLRLAVHRPVSRLRRDPTNGRCTVDPREGWPAYPPPLGDLFRHLYGGCLRRGGRQTSKSSGDRRRPLLRRLVHRGCRRAA